MTYVVGVIGAALIFGLFAMLRPREAGCTGQCAGCTGEEGCVNKRAAESRDETRRFE